MAIAPPRPCPHPGCGRFRCTNPAHQVAAWRSRVTSPVTAPIKRVRGRELQRRRARLFARQPWCVLCLAGVPHEQPVAPGTHTRATIRDHRIPLAEGGADDETNEQGICDDHNRWKTRGESQRGVRRSC